jgi:hypothetical protein
MNMPTLAETQLKELSAWIVASSQDEKAPLGNDFIRHDDYAQLVTVAMDDPAPDLSAAIALGCLPLLVAHDAPAATFTAIEGQAKLTNGRSTSHGCQGPRYTTRCGASRPVMWFASPTGRLCAKLLLLQVPTLTTPNA